MLPPKRGDGISMRWMAQRLRGPTSRTHKTAMLARPILPLPGLGTEERQRQARHQTTDLDDPLAAKLL